ncbi:MAG: bifunctional DNA-formamidopyrimidine glycosylase/DNA-(apurinic or apyrimidinic site) lyase [Paracoccaceae bacterium]
MPELPEVETVLRGISPILEGNQIDYAQVNRPDLRRPFPNNLAKRLKDRKINFLHRRSKYILIDLSGGETLVIHLGMSGRIIMSQKVAGTFHHNTNHSQKHDHFVLHLKDNHQLTFNDPRRFGVIDLLRTENLELSGMLSQIGPEPLSNSFNEAYFVSTLRLKKTNIKSALLDQRVVAGLGNIYVCEALFRAGISPKRQALRISHKKLSSLVPIIKEILLEAISSGGSSLRDFRNASGDLGYFQHSFDVYGREDQDCYNTECDSKIKRITQAGRSSFYCSNCQR